MYRQFIHLHKLQTYIPGFENNFMIIKPVGLTDRNFTNQITKFSILNTVDGFPTYCLLCSVFGFEFTSSDRLKSSQSQSRKNEHQILLSFNHVLSTKIFFWFEIISNRMITIVSQAFIDNHRISVDRSQDHRNTCSISIERLSRHISRTSSQLSFTIDFLIPFFPFEISIRKTVTFPQHD